MLAPPTRSVSLHLVQCAQLERDGVTPEGWTHEIAARYLVERAFLQTLRLFEEALPKFNWGASALDANAIQLLNETPGLVRHAAQSFKRHL